MNLLDVATAVLLLSGCLLSLTAALGLVRLPDVFSRMHAATKPSTLGLLLVVLGAVLQIESPDNRAKLLLVAVLQFVTAPVAAHMVGRAAYRSGAGALDDLIVDDLRAPAPVDPTAPQDTPAS